MFVPFLCLEQYTFTIVVELDSIYEMIQHQKSVIDQNLSTRCRKPTNLSPTNPFFIQFQTINESIPHDDNESHDVIHKCFFGWKAISGVCAQLKKIAQNHMTFKVYELDYLCVWCGNHM